MRWAEDWWSSPLLDQVIPWFTYLGSHFAVILFIILSWMITRSTAPRSAFEDRGEKRGSGLTLSKSWLSGRGVEGLTRQKKVLRYLILLYGIQSVVVYSLKFLVKRERPLFFLETASKLSKGPGEILDPSFPSAHATCSFMMATLLAVWFPRYWVIFYIIAGITGWTRIYLGVHYPTDVIAGALLGYGITKVFLQWAHELDIKACYFRDEKGS